MRSLVPSHSLMGTQDDEFLCPQSRHAGLSDFEMEKAETEKAIDELKKVADGDSVFKQAGTVLIKSDKKTLLDELEEKIELAKTRSTVLEKQEVRVKETLKEQEAKITEMMKSGNAPPPPAADDNPRK